MKTLLRFEDGLHEDLTAHLLPPEHHQEQAAFLFARTTRGEDEVVFDVMEAARLAPADFAYQEGDYLELADGTRASLIKRAHDLEASLVEMHSHIGPGPAAFSPSDRMGLKETVPHMWWRLKKRPYLAIVVARSGFDALVWIDDPKIPRALDGLVAGARLLKPTNNSLKGWS